jgi:hypothetical protein
MNVEIGAEAALFPEKEYISRIFVAVYAPCVRTIAGTLRSVPATPCPHCAPFLPSRQFLFIYLFKVLRFFELIWDRTHQAPSSKGRIVRWAHRPNDRGQKIGREWIKITSKPRKAFDNKSLFFVHILYNTVLNDPFRMYSYLCKV